MLSSMSTSLLVVLAAFLPAATLASPLTRGAPTPPTEDAFYRVPDSLQNIRPGTVLRHRKPPSPIAALGLLPQNLKDSHQFLYRTTDNFGNATATVLTVLIPHNADYGKVISYQSIEDASYANCAPSYVLQFASDTGGFFGTVFTQAELIIMDAMLAEGWIVILPDYEGPEAEFLANKQAGYAILDGIRAALSSSNVTGIKSDAKVGLAGYSGGSLASGFAAEQHPIYAPELRIVGAAIGGLVPDLPNAFMHINKGPFAGLIPTGIVGIANAYPSIMKLIDEQIKPQYREDFDKAKKQCLVASLGQNLFKDYTTESKDPAIFNKEPALSVLKENSQGQHVPTIPLLVYKSINDEVSPIADTDALIKFYCDGGTPVEYVRDFVSEHALLGLTGATLVLPWLRKVLNGEKIASKCSTRFELTTLTDPGVAGLPKFAVDALKALAGRPIGPGGLLG